MISKHTFEEFMLLSLLVLFGALGAFGAVIYAIQGNLFYCLASLASGTLCFSTSLGLKQLYDYKKGARQ